jgi:hypothetical protein
LLVLYITVFVEKAKFVDAFIVIRGSCEPVYNMEMLHNISKLPLSSKFVLTCDITTRQNGVIDVWILNI